MPPQRGIDGCLLTDLSVEEAEPYMAAMRGAGLDTVFLRCADQQRTAHGGWSRSTPPDSSISSREPG